MIHQQTQQVQNIETVQNSFALKKLKGIKPKGVKAKDKSKLEHLINLGIDTVDRCGHLNSQDDILDYIYWNVKRSAGDYNESDLKQTVMALSVTELNSENYVVGFYTGALLSNLTERNRAKGKRTQVCIDGDGMTFNYLFNHAKHVDDLIIKNFEGTNMCSQLGREGDVDFVMCSNLSGFGPMDLLGMNGSVNFVIAKDIEANSPLFRVAENGSSKFIAGINLIDGMMGNTFDVGDSDLAIIKDCYFKQIIDRNQWNRKANVVYVDSIKGKLTLSEYNEPNVGTCIHTDNSGEWFERKWFEKTISANRIISDSNQEEFTNAVKQYKINQLLEQINLIDEAPEQDVFKHVDEFKKIYYSIEPLLKKAGIKK